MTYTIAEENFRDLMGKQVVRNIDKQSDITHAVSPGLHYALNANIEPYRWGGAASYLIIETAYNLIDTGMNGGAVNAWEFREAIEHDGPNECAEEVKDNDTGAELAGLMYRNGWITRRIYRNSFGETSLAPMVDSFTLEIVDQIAGILYEIAQEIEETCQAEAELDDEQEG